MSHVFCFPARVDKKDQEDIPYFDAHQQYYEDTVVEEVEKPSLAALEAEIVPVLDFTKPKAKFSSSNVRSVVESSPMARAEETRKKMEKMEELRRKMEEEEKKKQEQLREYERLKQVNPFAAERYLEKIEGKKEKLEDPRKKLKRERAEAKALKEKEQGSKETRKKPKKEEGPPTVGEIADFKQKLSDAVAGALKPYLKEGKIADKDSFKHLCRKYTKELQGKEKKNGNDGRWNHKIGPAAHKYVVSCMEKLSQKGVAVYKKETRDTK